MAKAPAPFDLVRLFAALADPTRLRLLNLMNGQEVCVCYFVEILKQGQPKISRHLAYLRNAGLVSARREGKWMHYSIEWPRDEAAASILRTALENLKSNRELLADLERLGRASCDPQGFVALAGAPSPTKLEWAAGTREGMEAGSMGSKQRPALRNT
jgi:ArsR family transcriptional regulator, arsenate/arsenite/antimonite-responsive transcriptional repressor